MSVYFGTKVWVDPAGNGERIHAVWEVSVESITGTFSTSDAITWDSGLRSGTVVNQIDGDLLRFVLIAGSGISKGDVITGANGASAVVSSVPTLSDEGYSINPPYWKIGFFTKQGFLSNGDIVFLQTKEGSFVNRAISVVNGDSLFQVLPGFPPGFTDVDMYAARDYSTLEKLPLPQTGDRVVGELYKEGLLIAESFDPFSDNMVAENAGVAFGGLWSHKRNSSATEISSYVEIAHHHGRVLMSGCASKATSAMAVNDVVMVLPYGYRPDYTVKFRVNDGNDIQINTSGEVKIIKDGGVSDEIHFSQVAFVAT